MNEEVRMALAEDLAADMVDELYRHDSLLFYLPVIRTQLAENGELQDFMHTEVFKLQEKTDQGLREYDSGVKQIIAALGITEICLAAVAEVISRNVPEQFVDSTWKEVSDTLSQKMEEAVNNGEEEAPSEEV